MDASITPPQLLQWLEAGNALRYAQQYEEEADTLRAKLQRIDSLARQCRVLHNAFVQETP